MHFLHYLAACVLLILTISTAYPDGRHRTGDFYARNTYPEDYMEFTSEKRQIHSRARTRPSTTSAGSQSSSPGPSPAAPRPASAGGSGSQPDRQVGLAWHVGSDPRTGLPDPVFMKELTRTLEIMGISDSVARFGPLDMPAADVARDGIPYSLNLRKPSSMDPRGGGAHNSRAGSSGASSSGASSSGAATLKASSRSRNRLGMDGSTSLPSELRHTDQGSRGSGLRHGFLSPSPSPISNVNPEPSTDGRSDLSPPPDKP